MPSAEILKNLNKAVIEYDTGAAASWARKAIEEKMDPVEAVNAVTEAIRDVGDRFGKGELWLPDLVGAADAMQSAMSILEEEIKRRGLEVKSLGTVVIGTVYGDIHSIGKTMVATFLTASGFEVHDLGVNIKADEFVMTVEKHNADILAMSALMSTTAPEQRKVIDALNEKGVRGKVKIMVGGGAISQEFANLIGADGYAPTAPGAAELAMRLMREL
jgi:corrinoid protein of di/trimethylamine methyltransferase